MQIDSLIIKNYRNIEDLALEIGPGITLVKAPNEHGKTSVHDGIRTLLFADPKSSSIKLAERRRWGQEAMYELAAEFSVGEERYRLHKDFEGRSAVLENLNTGQKLTSKNKINEKMAEVLGLTSEVLFVNTACISAEDLFQVKNASDMCKRLEEKLAGIEGVTVSSLLKKLESRLVTLNKGIKALAKTPGPIKEWQDRVDELEEKYNRVKDIVDQKQQKEERFYELAGTLTELKEQLGRKQKKFTTCRDYLEAKNKLEHAQKEFRRVDGDLAKRKDLEEKVSQLATSLESIRQQGEQYGKIKKLVGEIASLALKLRIQEEKIKTQSSIIEKAQQESGRLEKAKQELARCTKVEPAELKRAQHLDSEIKVLEKTGQSQGFTLTIKPLSGVTPDIIADGVKVEPVGAVLDVRSEVTVIYPQVTEMHISNKNTDAAKNLAQEREYRNQLQELLAQYEVENVHALEKKHEQWREANQTVQNHKNALDGMLQGEELAQKIEQHKELLLEKNRLSGEQDVKVKEALEMVQKVEPDVNLGTALAQELLNRESIYESQYRNLQKDYQEVNGQLQNFKGQLEHIPDSEKLVKERQDWVREELKAETKLQDMSLPEDILEGIFELEGQIKVLEGEVGHLDREYEHLKLELSMTPQGAGDLFDIEEEIERARAQLATYRERDVVLQKVKELFEEARAKTLERIAAGISQKTSEYFAGITDGRYPEVEISPENLEIRIYAPNKQDYVNIDGELSTGTRDQIYLAARLAMLPAVADGKKPPILMDDTIVHFDSERRQKVFDILKEVAKEHQVIIFSCHDYYEPMVDRVINM